MKLELIRDVFEDFTLGKFYVDGKFLGFTCEDKDRKLEDGGQKVYGQTAIPRGTYKVILSYSHHFNKTMPEILNVPGFEGIRIHGGNTDKDTLGCLLLGSVRTSKGVANCAGVNTKLINLLEEAEDNGENVTIQIS